MTSAFQLTIDPNGIARLVFDHPDEKINVLSQPVMEELSEILDGITDNSHIKALVMTSAKKDIFIAGADVKEFKKGFNDSEKADAMLSKGHRIIKQIEDLPFPSVAVVHGACFGGGLELALGFTYRIVSDHPKTQLGLPEVNLGIFPGWGGTQRLPRLVGFIEGLKMIVTGKSVNGIKAWKIHLADAIASWEFLEEKTEEFISQILSKKGAKKVLKRRKPKGIRHYLLEANPIGRALVCRQTKKAILQKTKGQYPAPIAALNVVKNTFGGSLKSGLDYEKKQFIRSIPNEFQNAKNLIRIFFNQEKLKKDPGMKLEAPAKLIDSAAVIGAGVMGSGIAFSFSKRDVSIRMKDINWEAIGNGYGAIWKVYQTLKKIRKIKPEEAKIKFQEVSATIDYSGFAHRDLVIEAATEDLELKLQILADLENHISNDAIIATNTSSLTIAQLSKGMQNPERFVGMHFFNPVPRMPLVEVVPGEKTSQETIATAVEICRKLGKTPIVVQDCHGFLVNRIFAIAMHEAFCLLEEGVSVEQLDKAALEFGLPMGPCRLADEVGHDVNIKVMHQFAEAYGDRLKVPEMLDVFYSKGLHGRKIGKGFYLYDGKKEKVNPEVTKLYANTNNPNLSDHDIMQRIILGMVNEAGRCLEEKIVTDPAIVDMAMVMGTGFPPFRGGLFCYADELGINTVVRKLLKLEQMHGNRFAPVDLLIKMAEEGKTFY